MSAQTRFTELYSRKRHNTVTNYTLVFKKNPKIQSLQFEHLLPSSDAALMS